jgi:hypothetical protein
MTRRQDADKNSEGSPKRVRDLREANENVRKARDEDPTDVPTDSKKTSNKPAFDRDR